MKSCWRVSPASPPERRWRLVSTCGALRVAFLGALAMIATAGVGRLFGAL